MPGVCEDLDIPYVYTPSRTVSTSIKQLLFQAIKEVLLRCFLSLYVDLIKFDIFFSEKQASLNVKTNSTNFEMF